jgi:hypothetical protein
MHAVPTIREHIVQPHRSNPDTATKLTSPTHLRPSDSLTNSSPWELATTIKAMLYTLNHLACKHQQQSTMDICSHSKP